MRHLDAETLLMIVEGKLPPRVLLQHMWDHLRELCPDCRESMAGLAQEVGLSDGFGDNLPDVSWQGAAPGPLADLAHPAEADLACSAEPFDQVESTYDSVYSRAFEAAAIVAQRKAQDIEAERRDARRDLDELLAMEPAAWAPRVRNAYTRFRSRALAEEILACSTSLTRQDPEKSRQMAELVEDVVARIPGSSGQAWAHELKIRSKARQANAQRVGGSLSKADALFREIHEFLRSESLELEDLPAEVASLEGSLRDHQGRLEEAVKLHAIAVRRALVAGDTTSAASYRISRAEALRRHGELEEAQEDLTSALQHLSPVENPHLFACAVGSQIMIHFEAGQTQPAAEVFARHRSYLETHEDPWVRTHAVYLRGTVAWGLGRINAAEACFIEARDGMIADGQLFRASNIALDLAELYLETAQASKLKDLAQDLVTLFQTDHHQHQQSATVALTLFHQASLAEQVTKEAIRGLRRTLERAQTGARRSSFLPS